MTRSPRAAACLGWLVLLVGCVAAPAPTSPIASPPSSSSPVTTRQPATTPSAAPQPTTTVTPRARPRDTRTGRELDQPFRVRGVILVSKRHPISQRYGPDRVGPFGLTRATQSALARMQSAASRAGVRVVVRSGYRSYSTQAAVLARKIVEYGSETLARRYNAAPGRSEHQTGLAVDLSDGVSQGVARIRDSRTGKWLWSNSWRYGFILRYPPGKEGITGYAYEPWHFRYVGTDVAAHFGARSTLTLEEYLGVR